MQRAAHDETPLSAACERMHNLANQLVHFSGDSAWPCCIRQLDKKILKKKAPTCGASQQIPIASNYCVRNARRRGSSNMRLSVFDNSSLTSFSLSAASGFDTMRRSLSLS